MTFEYSLPKRGRALPPLIPHAASEPVGRPPRLARLVALAHKLAESAPAGQRHREQSQPIGISPARVEQIVMLAQLAPDIQEYVLFLPMKQASQITEPQLRAIAREPRWDRQRARFQKLLGNH